ncbi:MAG TPA: RdgB/HAM1 family non-canonical purine NTP pyrophosphatase [Bacteroidales bacterium]|nr:RdgB/HAM1 family non-canonical purine NTP pyrophosphatase [Bacteroidales bacterium]
MSITLIFATNNYHKLTEARNILADINILSLDDIKLTTHIPEDFHTLKENASQKSWYIYNKTKMNCFSDDTGLEVIALNGKPGVFSARYAGKQASYEDNMKKLLTDMLSINDRRAIFKTVISLIIKGKEFFFEGIVNGIITKNPKGNNGFGYDPIFIPEGYNKTFAELTYEEKNKLSHRAKALQEMAIFINYNKDKLF